MKLILMILFLSTQIFAQTDGNPVNWCRNGLFPRENVDFSLGTIKAKKGEKVYFFTDERSECPGGKKCQTRSYILANDEVIVSLKFGNYSCVWYQPKKGAETVGWIRSDKLELVNMIQSIDEYVGKWSFYDNEIEISKTGNRSVFNISGMAFWKGMGDNIHTGELEGVAKWNDSKLLFNHEAKDEYACKATLDLLGIFLIVSDNLNCGGANVTFTGVYRKNVKR
ncbi:MAG TPA: hypothetical protein PKE69_01320 [Pyrinomonadaceae bacterium]|nr:hypothetical protein [Pyrinomonadaceae bacterium]